MTFEVTTADGPHLVRNWGYRLQGGSRRGHSKNLDVADIAAYPHDLIVMDFSRDGSGAQAFGEAHVAQIKGRDGANRVVVSYISIGEASDYRDHWQDDWTDYKDPDVRAKGNLTGRAPAWLGEWNRDWPNSRKVRYWDPGWQNIVFNSEGTGWLDRIVAAGFDGAYLDIVDGYYHWGSVAAASGDRRPGDPASEREAAARMIDFIATLAQHARETNPEFLIIPQNGVHIIDALEDEDHRRRDLYLETINAIAAEDLFFRGDKAEDNRFDPEEEAVDALVRDFADSGVPVLSVDYIRDHGKIRKYYAEAIERQFLPYAAPSRELNVMGPPYDGSSDVLT